MRYLAIFSLFLISTIACNNAGESVASNEDSKEKVVHVYTARDYDVDETLYKLFEKETGIKVILTKDKGDILIQKILDEGKTSLADLLICVDAGQLNYAKKLGLFRPTRVESLDENVPLACRDRDRNWFGITKRAKILVYNKDLIDSTELSTYMDLSEPKWARKILIGPSQSVSNRSLLGSFVANVGKEKTLEWINGIADNMGSLSKGREIDQVQGVFDGKAAVAIVNSNVVAQFLALFPKSEDKLGVFFPNQSTTGVHINFSGAGIISESHNFKNTVKLLVFLTSKMAQEELSKELFEYPVCASAQPAPLLQLWTDYKTDDLDLVFLEQNQGLVSELLKMVTW